MAASTLILLAIFAYFGSSFGVPDLVPNNMPPSYGSPLNTNRIPVGPNSFNNAVAPQPSVVDNNPMGVEFALAYFCAFSSDHTYACKADCEEDTVSRNDTDRQGFVYQDKNCRQQIRTPNSRWTPEENVMIAYTPDGPKVLVGTCSFYKAMWYECFGVADCSRGDQGLYTCGGGAPWRGFYGGTPQTGFRGNVTAQAQNSAAVAPSGASRPTGMTSRPGPVPAGVQPPVTSAPQLTPVNPLLNINRTLLASCEKFSAVELYSCYKFTRRCVNSAMFSRTTQAPVAGAQTADRQKHEKWQQANANKTGCSLQRTPMYNTTENIQTFARFENILRLLDDKSFPDANPLVTCYFYDNNEFSCGFPSDVDFKESTIANANFSRPTGSFYNGNPSSLKQ